MVLVKGMLKIFSWIIGVFCAIILSAVIGGSILLKNGNDKTIQEMIEFFNTHEKEFSELNTNMKLLQKNEMIRIRADWVQPEKIQLRQQELEKIRKQMEALDIIGIDSFSNETDYITYSWGLSVTGGSKGYRFSQKPQKSSEIDLREPEESFQDQNSSNGSRSAAYRIRDYWFIYEEKEN